MRLFKIGEDLSRTKAGYIDAVRKWELPGVICPVCKCTWGMGSLQYPSVNLTGIPDARRYVEPWPVELEVFLKMRDEVWKSFPSLPDLTPGTSLGPSVGKPVGKLHGFVWGVLFATLLEASSLEKLKKTGLLLPASVKAELKFKGNKQEVFEFDLPLRGKLANPVYDGIQLDYCSACGRDSSTLPDEILIDAGSIPNDYDIFRVGNVTTIILVTERFVEAVTRLDIKGAVFEEVKTKQMPFAIEGSRRKTFGNH